MVFNGMVYCIVLQYIMMYYIVCVRARSDESNALKERDSVDPIGFRAQGEAKQTRRHYRH